MYAVINYHLKVALRKASTLFKQFEASGNLEDLTLAIKAFEVAVNKAEEIYDRIMQRTHQIQVLDKPYRYIITSATTDFAHSLRRYAAAVCRDYQDDQAQSQAHRVLKTSLSLFGNVESTDAVNVETAKALNQIIQTSYQLKDGKILQRAAEHTLRLYNPEVNNKFVVDAYCALYHCALSRGQPQKALDLHYEAARRAKACGVKYAFHSHEIKLKLSEWETLKAGSRAFNWMIESLCFSVKAHFKKLFSEHIDNYQRNNNYLNRNALYKDLSLLFIIRCKLADLNYKTQKLPPDTFVLKRAIQIFGNDYTKKIKCEALLQLRIDEIKERGHMSLCHTFFKDASPIGLKITKERLNAILTQAISPKNTIPERQSITDWPTLKS